MSDHLYSSMRRSRVPGDQPLGQLDNQALNASMIPLPSSALKRNANRMSLAHVASSRQSIAGPPSRSYSIRQGSIGNMAIEMAGQPRSSAASGRRPGGGSGMGTGFSGGPILSSTLSSGLVAQSTSRKSRPSSFGTGMFSVSTATSQSIKDPRPLRDKNYQANISQIIYDYLAANKFEVEMKHPLTAKTLKVPTQKDFVLIFQWLYKRLDPGYRFTKSLEYEVYFLLKTIHYPFLESINKSQISAVGGQNWPVFMGMLFWLVELNITLERYDNKEYESEETDDMILDRIFIRYVSKSYRAFLANEDDYAEYKTDMESEFADYSANINLNIEDLTQQNESLTKKYQQLAKGTESLNALEKKGQALESDLVKFKAYIDTMEKRKVKWQTVLEKIAEELNAAAGELVNLQQEKEELQTEISSQGLSPSDIDRMNYERDKMTKALEATSAKLEEMTHIAGEKELFAHRALDSLEQSLQKYTSSIYRVGITAADDNSQGFDIFLDSPLAEENLGQRPEVLLRGKDLRRSIRPALQAHRHEIGVRIHKAQDESIRLQELLDRVSESITEKKDLVEGLEAKLSASKLSYDVVYETTNSDASASHAEIERLERDLHAMNVTVQQGMLQLNQRSQSIAIEYDQLQHAVQMSRERMHSDVEKMISYIINFKLHVQSSLEDYERFVIIEYEKNMD